MSEADPVSGLWMPGRNGQEANPIIRNIRRAIDGDQAALEYFLNDMPETFARLRVLSGNGMRVKLETLAPAFVVIGRVFLLAMVCAHGHDLRHPELGTRFLFEIERKKDGEWEVSYAIGPPEEAVAEEGEEWKKGIDAIE